jgi:Fe-S oxidoreductase
MAQKTFGDPVDKMTAYCTYCPKMCRFSCPAAEAEGRETVTPWGMMRLFELVKDGAVEPSQEVAEVFYHCMGCRRCQNWCRHQNDVPQAMWEARAWMAELGHVPEALEGFAETFTALSFPHRVPAPLVGGEEEVFDETSDIVFFPDCETRQHRPELVWRAGRMLEVVCGKKVRLVTHIEAGSKGCCGFSLLSAGQREAYLGYRAELEAELATATMVVTDCAAFAALHREETSWGFASELEVTHVIELLASRLDGLDVPAPQDLSGLIFHDSCFTGRQLGLFEESRKVVAALGAGTPMEFLFNRAEASCCGGPSHYHVVEAEGSEQCAKDLLTEMDRKGALGVVCGSATCKKAFERAGTNDVAVDILELATRAFGF